MDQYTYTRLRNLLRGAATVDNRVRDVQSWRTDRQARERIATEPSEYVKAAARVLVHAASEDLIVELLSPCFTEPLGAMRLRMAVHEVIAELPMTPAQALAELVDLCERNAVITATDLAKYKKVLGQ